MKTKLTNKQKFNLLYRELANWIDGSDHNGSLEFAFRNGFDLHAVSIWYGSGASQYDFGLRINRTKEIKEIHALCDSADIFICPSCNHHSFFDAGEVSSDTTKCESCLKTMKIESRAKQSKGSNQ
ncbi:MAG: hypothetical protein ACRCST_00630 [Turicibacter sp.]